MILVLHRFQFSNPFRLLSEEMKTLFVMLSGVKPQIETKSGAIVSDAPL